MKRIRVDESAQFHGYIYIYIQPVSGPQVRQVSVVYCRFNGRLTTTRLQTHPARQVCSPGVTVYLRFWQDIRNFRPVNSNPEIYS